MDVFLVKERATAEYDAFVEDRRGRGETEAMDREITSVGEPVALQVRSDRAGVVTPTAVICRPRRAKLLRQSQLRLAN